MTTTNHPTGTKERRFDRDDTRPGVAGQVRIRELVAGDEEGLRDMFRRLSRETIYRRFHVPYPQVPEAMLVHLANLRDGRSLVAVAGDEIVGHAVYAGETRNKAEIAVVVEDQWQSRGIGKKLLAGLALRADGRGIATFTAAALAENRRVLNLVDAVFAGVRYAAKGRTYDIRIALEGLRSPAGAEDESRPAA